MKKHVVRLLTLTLGERRTFDLAVRTRRIRYRLGMLSKPDFDAGALERIPFPRSGAKPLPEAFARARVLPGSLTDEDLVLLFEAGRDVRSACIFAAEPEAIQAATMLYAGGTRRIDVMRPSPKFLPDLVVMQNGAVIPPDVQLPAKAKILQLSGLSEAESRRAHLRHKLQAGGRLRILFINDVGFQYGAGVATRRQAQSFLMAGWDVAMLSWDAGTAIAYPAVARVQAPGRWVCVRSMADTHHSAGLDDAGITERIVEAAREVNPDFILVGNIHGAGWPIDIMPALRDAGYAVAAYMHDLHWVTGRCAYPGSCRAFLEAGCDADCPTAEQYPSLPRSQIHPAWARRAEVFTGPGAIPLLTNSDWTSAIARARFGAAATIRTVHLGLDHRQFARIDRKLARRLLGIETDVPLALMGSVNVKEERKGGPIFLSVLEQLHRRTDVGVLMFGHGSDALPCTKAFGLVTDERMMALIYSAADFFIGTAREEAFGQTLLEASAAGLPVVAFRVGGVVEAVEDGGSAILVDEFSAGPLIAAIDRLLTDKALATRLGQTGERRAAELFSLPAQADAWRTCLKEIF
jgi:glycosyltransferase involved in cell wall biosynthesis